MIEIGQFFDFCENFPLEQNTEYFLNKDFKSTLKFRDQSFTFFICFFSENIAMFHHNTRKASELGSVGLFDLIQNGLA